MVDQRIPSLVVGVLSLIAGGYVSAQEPEAKPAPSASDGTPKPPTLPASFGPNGRFSRALAATASGLPAIGDSLREVAKTAQKGMGVPRGMTDADFAEMAVVGISAAMEQLVATQAMVKTWRENATVVKQSLIFLDKALVGEGPRVQEVESYLASLPAAKIRAAIAAIAEPQDEVGRAYLALNSLTQLAAQKHLDILAAEPENLQARKTAFAIMAGFARDVVDAGEKHLGRVKAVNIAAKLAELPKDPVPTKDAIRAHLGINSRRFRLMEFDIVGVYSDMQLDRELKKAAGWETRGGRPKPDLKHADLGAGLVAAMHSAGAQLQKVADLLAQ